ncbi:hypothetical protein GPECTOR_47g310 [Gonium pectorale]|uniref:Uncharacterized protein n=1 Tax=Gonium pectorale TaxID=33097 RepID=A0A150G907_GONPE|nr:hypothetical protein GPECTOR_47g310 [Gonium pectorale]|eukprot:KXZ46035.1 hypothetical protein GPECTOR_47g310 [Gonium pectorale]
MAQPLEAPAREHWSSSAWPQLLPELAERIVGCLDRNDIAVTFRHVNKATAARFSCPQHATIRLSEPVPPHAFAAHWLAPGAMRGLNLERRKQLVRLVAATGVLPNVEVVLQAMGFMGAAAEALMGAAVAGQLSMCQWLWDHNRSLTDDVPYSRFTTTVLQAAASEGHQHVCEWLLATDHTLFPGGAVDAAVRGGHVALAE